MTYDDLEVQNVALEHYLDPSDVQGGSVDGYFKTSDPIDYPEGPLEAVDGTLERGELAELVGIVVHSYTHSVFSEDQTSTPSRGVWEFELSDEQAPSMIAQTPIDIASQYIDPTQASDIHNRVLMHLETQASGDFLNDGSGDFGTGVAGGGDYEANTPFTTINFREFADYGPIFDRHDSDLYEHLRAEVYNAADQAAGMEFTIHFSLLWNVMDEENAPFR
jgi:hypothetical protein